MPQNKQEKLLSLITKYSVGSDFVFEPDEYRKGNATREPADLVWFVNGCAVLIYMRYYHSGKSAGRNRSKSSKSINHNLRQAEGWIKEWRSGRPLIGRNEKKEFSISYKEVSHTVVLSVVNGRSCQAKYHLDFSIKNNISSCGTLPQRSIEELIRHGASSIDIIHFLTKLSHVDDYIDESVCIKYVKNDMQAIVDKVDPQRRWIKDGSKAFEYLSKSMKALLYNESGDISDLSERLSDLPSMDYWILVTYMLSLREESKKNTKVLWSRLNLPVSEVHVVVACGTLAGTAQNMKEILKLNDPIDGKTPSFMVCWHFIDGDIENKTIGINSYCETPYVQRYLDKYLTRN